MSIQSSASQGQDLGGGIRLLPKTSGFPIEQEFFLQQIYSLGSDAFYIEPGLVTDALNWLGINRLQDVRQLQFISMVSVGDVSANSVDSHVFPHSRLIHSLRAAALHAFIGQALGLDQKQILIGILAEVMHDMFTCAGGDSWKDMNHQRTLFDEDHDIARNIFNIHRNSWRKLCAKYGFVPEITARAVEDVIHGVGLSGEIHEIADTASYLLGDLQEICRISDTYISEDFKEILDAAKRPWDVWNLVVKKDGHIAIKDDIALSNFLFLRALLWKNLYQNPKRKVLEMLLNKIVYPYLVRRQFINTKLLPTKTDSWLMGLIKRKMGWGRKEIDLNLLGSFPQLATFASWAEALAFERKKVCSGFFTLVFSVGDFQETKSKTDKYWVVDSSGRVGLFQDIFPEHAAAINLIVYETMSPALPVQVVYVENPQMSGNFRRAWQGARSIWLLRNN